MTVLEGVRETLIKHIPLQGVNLFTRLHDLPTKATGLPEGTLLLSFSYSLRWNLAFIAVLLLVFVVVLKVLLAAGYSPSKQGSLGIRSSQQSLTSRPQSWSERNKARMLTAQLIFSTCVLFRTQNPGNSAAHGRLVLPTSVHVKDHPAQTHAQPRNPFLRLSAQVTLYYVKLTK